MTRVTFSDGPQPSVNVQLPSNWGEVQDGEMREVMRILCKVPKAHWRMTLFRYFAGAHVERLVDGRIQMRFRKAPRRYRLQVPVEDFEELTRCLDFVGEIGSIPARIPTVTHGKYKAVDARLHGVSFGDWLRAENLYQGFLQSRNFEALHGIASIMYPGFGTRRYDSLDEVEVFALLQWMVQLKAMFSQTFKDFFRPSGTGAVPSMADVMNSQIRALTGGDVSKEEYILSIDVWRALTELNYKAREAEEMRRELDRAKTH